jgi:hypothetical protein
LQAAPARADSVRAERQTETLAAGGAWRSDILALDQHLTLAGRELRLHARAERESRPLGSAARQYLQGSITVAPGAAFELGAGHGSGAPYSWRSAQHASWYQGVAGMELSAGVARRVYARSSVVQLSASARLPLAANWTAITGLSGSRTEGRDAGAALQLGLEAPLSACRLAASAYLGRELAAPEQAGSALLASRTVHARLRCPLGPKLQFEFAASTTRAAQLTREGVSGAVVFSY